MNGTVIFPMFAGLVGFIIWIAVIIAIFQIRNATQETNKKLDAIYQLMSERNKLEK